MKTISSGMDVARQASSLKRLVFGLVLTFAFTAPASASTIFFFECPTTCGPGALLGMSVHPDAFHDGTGQLGGDVEVGFLSPVLYGQNALGFNIAGSHAGLTITDLSPGFTVGGTNQTIGPFGAFEFTIDGPPAGFPGNTIHYLSFTISRDGGFANDMSVFEMNAAGFFAAANVFDYFNPSITGTIGSDEFLNVTPVPEPGTMMLLATGLAAAWRARRRSHERIVAWHVSIRPCRTRRPQSGAPNTNLRYPLGTPILFARIGK